MTDAPKKRARLTGDQRMAVVIEKQGREVDRLAVRLAAASEAHQEAQGAYTKALNQLVRYRAAAELES
jgi:hypothetical protein